MNPLLPLWLQISVPVLGFTALVVVLASLVLGARQRLLPRGQVVLNLGGSQQVNVAAGTSLLAALAEADILLPAACGGRGSCGQCRVQLDANAGPVLPVERNHLDRLALASGWRLACMVQLQSDLHVRLPAHLLTARQLTCTVRASRWLGPWLKEITLALPEGETLGFDAGSWIMVEAPAGPADLRVASLPEVLRPRWAAAGLDHLNVQIPTATRRAYSLANPPTAADQITLVVRIALPPTGAADGTPPGQVSTWLCSRNPGDSVDLSGPFGDFRARPGDREMVLIGGGAGIAPLHSMVLDQLSTAGNTRRISLWYGARSLDELCYADEFQALAERHPNFSYHVALSAPAPDSPWQGPTGFVHNLVHDHHLAQHHDPQAAEYYLCGPPLMSAAVRAMLEDLGVEQDQVFDDNFGA